MTQTNDDFFGNAPANYEVPKSESRYMKFKEVGAHKFRILEKPIFGFEGWKTVDGKDIPLRFRMNEKPADTSAFKHGELNHFWAMPVWNYKTGRVEVLSFISKTIQGAIESYARNEEWGSPLNYNITVTRTGTTKDDTKYTTIASPHSDVTPEIAKAWAEIKDFGFNINELFVDGDPFKPGTPAPVEAAPVAEHTDDIAPEEVA
jgi:hypothetical protein